MTSLEVKNIRENAGMTQKEFADKLSVSHRTVQTWESGERNVSESRAVHIKSLFRDTQIASEPLPSYNGGNVKDSRVMHVSLVQQYAYAGYLSGFGDDEYLEELPTHPFIVDDIAYKGRYMAFQVRGDSMDDGNIRSYPGGAIVLGREVQRQHWQGKLHINRWPAFVIVHREAGILIKQIVKHSTDQGLLTLHSLNDQFDDFDVRLDDCIQIFNVIKKVIDE